jgi:hypothetical protein
MLDNEQIVADLDNGEWAFYYCAGFNQETIRQVFRDLQGKLFIRYPDYRLTPLGKDEPEILLGKVPTSLELTCLTDDKLKERLRLTAQILVAEVGADGPMNAEDVALKVVELIKGLRDEIKTVRKAAQALEAQRDDYAARYEFMVKRSCDERLDGYRELGHKCAQLEEERDKALAEVKRLNSLLSANRLLTRAAIHNMVQPEQVGGYIYGCPQPDEIRPVKSEPTAAQEREAIVAWLRSEPIYRNRPWAVISADIERGEHWPKDKGTL